MWAALKGRARGCYCGCDGRADCPYCESMRGVERKIRESSPLGLDDWLAVVVNMTYYGRYKSPTSPLWCLRTRGQPSAAADLFERLMQAALAEQPPVSLLREVLGELFDAMSRVGGVRYVEEMLKRCRTTYGLLRNIALRWALVERDGHADGSLCRCVAAIAELSFGFEPIGTKERVRDSWDRDVAEEWLCPDDREFLGCDRCMAVLFGYRGTGAPHPLVEDDGTSVFRAIEYLRYPAVSGIGMQRTHSMLGSMVRSGAWKHHPDWFLQRCAAAGFQVPTSARHAAERFEMEKIVARRSPNKKGHCLFRADLLSELVGFYCRCGLLDGIFDCFLLDGCRPILEKIPAADVAFAVANTERLYSFNRPLAVAVKQYVGSALALGARDPKSPLSLLDQFSLKRIALLACK